MGIIKSFDIKNLLPFKKRDGMPETVRGPEEKMIELDPTLNHEEQVYVAHYLGYADLLLGNQQSQPEPIEKRVIEMPQQKQEPSAGADAESKDEVA
jgi:hypothetical protein